MKGFLDRTKVVLRHLPPAITETMLVEQLDTAFAGRYNWLSFRPGKSSQKHQSYSRAYIDFKMSDYVLEFAEFFNGHVFVNEKGTQFKAIVEYAPSQCVPKQWSKKDGREGTILKDPEYLEFLESLAKPVENLPSAEIQLERKEAERAGVPKDTPIVTPLMDFVRQKRAAKGGSRRPLSNGKLSRRAGRSSVGSPISTSSKRGSEKRRASTTMYVLRDSLKNASGKDKSTYMLISKRDEQKLSDKPVILASSVGTENSEEESGLGVSGNTDAVVRKKVLLRKGKERETSHVVGSMSQQHIASFPIKEMLSSTPTKPNSRREGRMIRGILLNKEAHQNQSSGVQLEQQLQTSSMEKDRRRPRHSHAQVVLKDTNNALDDKVFVNDLHGSVKPERRSRNKDRLDRSVWTLRRSDGSYASDESSASQSMLIVLDSSEGLGAFGDTKVDLSNARGVQVKTNGNGRNNSLDNGSHKHVNRRAAVDGSSVISDGKPGKRSSGAGFSSHEKQVWVQKSSSGS